MPVESDLIWMTLLVFAPCVFALGLLFFPRGKETAMCWWSLIGTAVTLGISIAIFIGFKQGTLEITSVKTNEANRAKASLEVRTSESDSADVGSPEARLNNDWVARYTWIERFNIEYFLGIDGISMPLILLTTFLSFLSMMASFGIKRYDSSERFVKGYCMLFLLLETGMLGAFVALDFFLFYIFWEVMLLPMYFLIGVWGGPRREYAAIKFFLYTLLGSVFILIALLGFYFSDMRDFVDPHTTEAAAKRVATENGWKWEEAADRKKAFAKAEVNTFDLVALARAGRGALQYLGNDSNPEAVSASPVLNEIEALPAKIAKQKKDIATLEATRPTKEMDKEKLAGRVATAKATLRSLEDRLALCQAIKPGFEERLSKQWFFTPGFQLTMFLFLLIGFAIKVPVFPFHTWLPDAHVEAPTPISMILAGVLLKLGGYGILRIAYPICPWAAEHLATWVALFGVISIVYGAFAAMAQTDFKKLVAYSSVSHMGYVLLGIAVWSTPDNRAAWSLGMNGAMFQMIAHGITSAGMFFLVGVIYDRAHHRNLDNFRGLYEPMPMYGGISAIMFFAAMGLPGMCGFIGEVMVVLAAWKFAPGGMQWVGITFSVLAALTVVLTAAYILWTIQRVFMGTNDKYKNYQDMTAWEKCCAVPLVVFAVLLGVLPQVFVLDWMEPSVSHLVESLVKFKV